MDADLDRADLERRLRQEPTMTERAAMPTPEAPAGGDGMFRREQAAAAQTSASPARSVIARFVEIPVWRYGKVVAYAKVDPFDAQWLAGRRWRLSPNGYAVTTGADRTQTAWMHRELLGLTRGHKAAVRGRRK